MTTLSAYLAGMPAGRRERVDALRDLIRSLYPDATESMDYKMPTFRQGEGWVAVANQKQYISLYTCAAEHLAPFKEKHPKINTGKGCIRFKDRDELPLADLEQVIKSAMEFRH
ncbi:MAG: DUF1801 domain-containing protein [Halioglobus sp.]|nr:DUF1801 domain-containing protein [Halioglobus sp.]